MDNLISRQVAIDALNALIDRFERILKDIRETKEDDSVCGMCEYDGAYIGQTGDWCNECPGFDVSDCFKLSEKCRRRWLNDVCLSPAEPEQRWIPCSERLPIDAGHYLCSFKKPNRIDRICVGLAYWTGGRWYGYMADAICAWKPLPEPYKGGQNER